MEVSGDTLLWTYRRKFCPTWTRLSWTRGWLRTILPQPGNILPNGEDILRISVLQHETDVSRVAEGSRGVAYAPFESSLEKRNRVPSFPFFSFLAFSYVPISLRRPCTRTWRLFRDGFRFFDAHNQCRFLGDCRFFGGWTFQFSYVFIDSRWYLFF